MDRNARRPAKDPASGSRLRRWLTPQQPQLITDSSEFDLGYESALPWFSASEAAEDAAPETLPVIAEPPVSV